MDLPNTTCRICSVEGVVNSNPCNQSPDDSNKHLLKVITICSPEMVKGDDVNVVSQICVVCKQEMLRLHRFIKVLEQPVDLESTLVDTQTESTPIDTQPDLGLTDTQPESRAFNAQSESRPMDIQLESRPERDDRGYLGDYNSVDENSSDDDGSSQSSECADEFVRGMKSELKELKTHIVECARRIGFDKVLGNDKRFANLTNNNAPIKKSMQKRIIAKLMKRDLKQEPFECKICKKTFDRKSKLLRHRLSHKNHVCPKTVCKKPNLEDNLMPSLQCGMCSIKLLPNGNVHFMCDICGEDFPRPSLLLQHKELHVGERILKCPVCDVEFAQMSKLRRHLSTHLEKRFKCDDCGTAFALKSDLDVHMVIHARRNRYACKVCPREFSCKLVLNEHMKSHMVGPPFKCIICQQRFAKLAEFRRHAALHEEERAKLQPFEIYISSTVKLEDQSTFNEMPFKCDTCSQGFELKADLETHSTVHAGDRPFKCKICQKGFTLKKELTAHLNMFEFENSLKALHQDIYNTF